MRLTHTYNPPDAPTSRLLALNDPDAGILAISLRPTSKRPNYVYRDLLTALGKDRDYGARTKSVAEDRSVVSAYLRAHAITRIVAMHGEWARASDEVLDVLLTIASEHDLDLDLVSELDENNTATEFVTAAGGHHLDWEASRFTPPPPIGPAERFTFAFPPEVPHVDFPLFRASCQHLLTAEEFRTVDGAYTFAFRSARAVLAGNVTTGAVIEFLRIQMAAVANPAHATTIIRACQAAAFTNGIMLKLDLAGLGYFIANANHRALTPDELRLLRRINTPWKAAAVVLTDAGMSIDQIRALRITDLDETGGLADTGVNSRLRDEGRLHLRALRLQRRAEEDGEPAGRRLVPAEDRAIRSALYNARRDLGIPLDISRWRSGAKKDPFEADLGLSVHRITEDAAA
jgi:hypothetical protein